MQGGALPFYRYRHPAATTTSSTSINLDGMTSVTSTLCCKHGAAHFRRPAAWWRLPQRNYSMSRKDVGTFSPPIPIPATLTGVYVISRRRAAYIPEKRDIPTTLHLA